MKNILVNIGLFILIPIAFILFAAFLMCGDIKLLKFLIIDIIVMILMILLYNKLYGNKKS
jgi:hypothetical protein